MTMGRLLRNRRELLLATAQLRHAYAQLAAGTVRDQKRFADGLIAPAIRKLEELLGEPGTHGEHVRKNDPAKR